MPARLAALALAASLAAPVRAADPGEPAAPQRPGVVQLRFASAAPLDAQVTYRRTRTRTGARPSRFVARYAQRASQGEAGLRLEIRDTRWEGDLPFPPAVAEEAIRASEQVVQRIGPDGRFAGLDGAEAMRPVLERLFEDAKVPAAQAERAVALAEGALRADAEESWNLAVGFWTGADLELGEEYVTQGEGELPLAPGVRATSRLVFAARRRVPCAAGERAARCVELTLRSTPERAAVQRAARELLARLAAGAEEVPAGAREDLAVESELLLVTEPETLRPFRLVWTKAARAGLTEAGAPALEEVDRSEYDWRYLPPPAPRPPRRHPKPRPPEPPPAPAPVPAPEPVAAPTLAPPVTASGEAGAPSP